MFWPSKTWEKKGGLWALCDAQTDGRRAGWSVHVARSNPSAWLAFRGSREGWGRKERKVAVEDERGVEEACKREREDEKFQNPKRKTTKSEKKGSRSKWQKFFFIGMWLWHVRQNIWVIFFPKKKDLPYSQLKMRWKWIQETQIFIWREVSEKTIWNIFSVWNQMWIETCCEDGMGRGQIWIFSGNLSEWSKCFGFHWSPHGNPDKVRFKKNILFLYLSI